MMPDKAAAKTDCEAGQESHGNSRDGASRA
jgi:hypothetical protein